MTDSPDYTIEEYEAAVENHTPGDVYASTTETILVTDTTISPETTTGTITYVPIDYPAEEHATTMNACEFDTMTVHTSNYVEVEPQILQRASDIMADYISHNLSIDANRLGVTHPHSAASTVGDVVAASLITNCTHDWPPEILNNE